MEKLSHRCPERTPSKMADFVPLIVLWLWMPIGHGQQAVHVPGST